MDDPVPHGLIYDLPLLAVFVLLVASFLATTWLGAWLGRRIRRADEHAHSHFSTIQGAMFGLMALLLAFSFAMAAGRFEARKQLVLTEANAIATADLRAGFLPAGAADEVHRLLVRYVDARLDYFGAGRDRDAVTAALRDSASIHQALWRIAQQASSADPRNVGIGLFVESVNEVIDLHEMRLAAMNNRVPETVLVLLYLVGVITMLGVGFGSGLGGKELRFPGYLAIVLVAAVMVLVLDLDRPRRGLIEVGQGSLQRLQQELSLPDAPP